MGGDVETWRRVYKIIMDREDKAVAGIGDEFQHDFSCNDYSTANHIDMDKFKATVLLSDAMPIGAEFAIISAKEER